MLFEKQQQQLQNALAFEIVTIEQGCATLKARKTKNVFVYIIWSTQAN